jgi:2-(1,2-epoxy-1,2-dihydrophenyl)acetyl-CoA isomerase
LADKVLIERNESVAILRISDPATRNAVNSEVIERIGGFFQNIPQDVRAVVLAGSEKAFSSGANMWGDSQFDMTSPDYDAGETLRTEINPMMQAIKESRVPVISAVRGAAVGIGAAIALAADIVVAGSGAFFIVSFAHVGLAPDSGAPYLLARSVGRIRAMELMLLGERLPAQKALEWGLVTRVVADDAVEATALEFAAKLGNGPTRTLGMTRQVVWQASAVSWEDELRLECGFQTQAFRTEDFKEGLAAFAEKRPPRFTGK